MIEIEKKIKIQGWIPKSLDAKFRELITQKYNKYERGLLSYELEMALRSWLSLHADTQRSIDAKKHPNPEPKARIAFFKIKSYLLSNFYYELSPGQQVPLIHLHRAIENVIGTDQRTINKWMRIFDKNGLIKQSGSSATWEII